jgi:hypothetical protein
MLQGSLQWSQLIAENPEYLAYVSASPRKSNAIENAFCHKTENFSGSNVDRTIANAYIIRKELSNLRHAAFECKITHFISISTSE